jgi:hypothetical protein
MPGSQGPPGIGGGDPTHEAASHTTNTRPHHRTGTRQSSPSERYRRHRQARRDHVLSGCEWCRDMADGREILADETAARRVAI